MHECTTRTEGSQDPKTQTRKKVTGSKWGGEPISGRSGPRFWPKTSTNVFWTIRLRLFEERWGQTRCCNKGILGAGGSKRHGNHAMGSGSSVVILLAKGQLTRGRRKNVRMLTKLNRSRLDSGSNRTIPTHVAQLRFKFCDPDRTVQLNCKSWRDHPFFV
jgi:hypothetical protein